MAIIDEVKKKLEILDMALNILQVLPEIIQQHVRLPEAYREYVTLRIYYIFIKMKVIVNKLMIQKNELIMELLNKIKRGAIDEKLAQIFKPIETVLKTIISVQAALNTAMGAIIKALQQPGVGIDPQGYGFLMTAKSVQVGQYSSKMLIPIVPEVNKVLPVQTAMNCIPYEKIDALVKKALPPI
jgi:hypothetical protein